MRWQLPIWTADRRVTRPLAASASPGHDYALAAFGLLADARVLLTAGFLWRAGLARTGRSAGPARHFLSVIATTTVLHHAIKRIVAQPRPDRVYAAPRGHRPVRTGRPGDAFPSGHAMHAGALASLLAAASPSHRVAIWSAGLLVASTRVALRAHWPTGVAAGFLAGVAVERAWRRRLGR